MDTEQYQHPGSYSIFEEIKKEHLVPVSSGVRFVNFIIDLIVVLGVGFAFEYAVLGVDPLESQGLTFAGSGNYLSEYIRGWITNGIIYSIMEGLMGGRSIGKLVTRTHAVRRDGSAFTWKDAIARSFARGIPFNELSIFFGEPWHDRLSKTTVVLNEKQ